MVKAPSGYRDGGHFEGRPRWMPRAIGLAIVATTMLAVIRAGWFFVAFVGWSFLLGYNSDPRPWPALLIVPGALLVVVLVVTVVLLATRCRGAATVARRAATWLRVQQVVVALPLLIGSLMTEWELVVLVAVVSALATGITWLAARSLVAAADALDALG
ncbi:Hypothetical protein I5071_71710 [Sandaracinus amylolyticus]|nr:Hypothetical protein I5071_71710 [Sandaracinus amylolyticus]